ncbi:ATP-binding protein [Streptomyces sp. cmx-18-6]|uniref:ATP-binding protein n=1 Tax=Streptomyces sp. cmx-18-6 TaxID=2790930 RepID=UPI0039814B28
MTAATPMPLQPNPLSGENYRLTLPNTASAARLARDFVTSLLGVSRHPGLVDDARVCVSELVTNAHRHTRTPLIRVHVAVNRKRVTVAVTDDGGRAGDAGAAALGTFGSMRAAVGPEEENGRGLVLVESLAQAWGTRSGGARYPGRTVVWFTLGRPEPTP